MNGLRQRLDRSDRDGGLSLVELVAAMAITSLALAMVGAFFLNVSRITVNGRGDRQATGVAANAMDEISRVVRVAADIPQASGTLPAVQVGSGATSITVYAWTDVDPASATPAPSKVTFTVDGSSNLVEQRVVGTKSGSYWDFSGAVTTTRTLPGPLSVAYVYYADSTDPTVAPTQVSPTTTAAALSVSSVAITVTAQKKAFGSVGQVRTATTVLMPNTKAS